MKNKVYRFISFFTCIVVYIALLPLAVSANNFVIISLPYGVQIELPKNWEVLSNKKLVALDTSVQSILELSGIFDATHDLKFGANYYNDKGENKALMNIRYYPNIDISQSDAGNAGQSEISEIDSAARESSDKSGKSSGFSIIKWSGTNKQVINGAVVFITEYKRSPITGNGIDNVIVRLVRVFNGGKTFTLTISYHEDQEYLLRPICDRVISSIRI